MARQPTEMSFSVKSPQGLEYNGHNLDTLFALSTRVAVLADKKVIVTGPPHEVAHFKHPFIEHFFMGERGQRAMAPLQPPAPAATPNAAAPSKET